MPGNEPPSLPVAPVLPDRGHVFSGSFSKRVPAGVPGAGGGTGRGFSGRSASSGSGTPDEEDAPAGSRRIPPVAYGSLRYPAGDLRVRLQLR